MPSLPGYASGGSANSSALSLEPAQQERYLTIDWDLPTEIVADEDGLEISAAAFAEGSTEDRIISVVKVDEDGNATELATWNFGTDSHPELADSTAAFDASLAVTRIGGDVTVSIKANSELLAALRPTLTVPNASGGVKHDDTGVASGSGSDGSVSFTVTSRGMYEISEENKVIPETPTTPSVPGTPVRPSEPEDEGAELPFTDVEPGAWYYDAVEYVYTNGLMDGVSATDFNPDGNMTRAMLVTILWRLADKPVVNYLLPFTDVPGEAWYTEAVRWAASEGIVTGVSDENFAPNAEITREQLATMLWRFAGSPPTDGSGVGAFDDGESVSLWAFDAVSWALNSGIITGVSDDMLLPANTATRSQCSAILMRYVENI